MVTAVVSGTEWSRVNHRAATSRLDCSLDAICATKDAFCWTRMHFPIVRMVARLGYFMTEE